MSEWFSTLLSCVSFMPAVWQHLDGVLVWRVFYHAITRHVFWWGHHHHYYCYFHFYSLCLHFAFLPFLRVRASPRSNLFFCCFYLFGILLSLGTRIPYFFCCFPFCGLYTWIDYTTCWRPQSSGHVYVLEVGMTKREIMIPKLRWHEFSWEMEVELLRWCVDMRRRVGICGLCMFLSKKKHWNQENQNNYYSKARIATWIYGDAWQMSWVQRYRSLLSSLRIVHSLLLQCYDIGNILKDLRKKD